MPEVAAIVLSLVLGILSIAAAYYLLPIGLESLRTARYGAKRVRRLDEADAQAGEVARSGGRTVMAISFALGSFGVVVLLLLVPLAAGVSFENTPVIVILRFLANLFLNRFGVTV